MLKILLVVLDLGGTFVFAISGALVAVRRRLDVFGMIVLSFAAGNAGGITRDLLIGASPPAAVADWKYVAVSAIAGVATFVWHPAADRFRNDVLWCDAVGLAFFAVAGTQKALLHGLHPAMAALLGMLTGIGGGMVRDVLVNEIPIVLRTDVYALAALAGATVVAVAHVLHMSAFAATLAGGALCFALRFGAIRYGWYLPTAETPRRSRVDSDAKARRDKSPP
jgi:uncharacterized membrane protein YeiH